MEENKNTKTNGFNIAALVLGIVSIATFCIWIISIPCAILALIFGIIGLKKPGKGMGLTGIITGSITIAIVVLIINFVIMGLFIFNFGDIYDYNCFDYDSRGVYNIFTDRYDMPY